VFDGEVLSAPTIDTPIPIRTVEIQSGSGSFTVEQSFELATMLVPANCQNELMVVEERAPEPPVR
jgi:preprotein translocase subunit SecD